MDHPGLRTRRRKRLKQPGAAGLLRVSPSSAGKLLWAGLAEHDQIRHVAEWEVVETVTLDHQDHGSGLIEKNRIVMRDGHGPSIIEVQLERHERPRVQGPFYVAGLNHILGSVSPIKEFSIPNLPAGVVEKGE